MNMDEICSAALEKICALGPPGRNIILSADELFEVFPEGAARSDSELKKALKVLSAEGYIDIKYSGGDMFCLTPLKNYLPELKKDEEEVIPPAQKDGRREFLSGFLGGFLGSALAGIIFAVIFWVWLC